ncbi:MAG: PQQ-like beta-propeller repeat protein, partial [Kiritimatiellae bacterium]|nr:PQQ-like beta-propeller repeat protein [Kiritimatiellia bacterium]
NGSPVIADDRIFVCAEPDELLCVRKSDGKVLWQTRVPLEDTWSEEDRAMAAEAQKQSEALKREYQRLDDEINETWEKKSKDPQNQELKDKFRVLRQEQAKVLAEISRLSRWAPAKTEPSNGYTSATPVTDGKHVWVVMGTGVAACFDMEGRRLWIKFIARPKHQEGHAASPVLAGGKLLLHVNILRAYDPFTGDLIWEQPAVGHSWGTSFPVIIGQTPAVVTARGQVVRVADGAVLASDVGRLEYASPLVVDGVAYFIENGGRASRLVATPEGTVQVERIWVTQPKKERYYASPLLYEGLLYTMHQKNLFSVIDAATGEVIREEKLDLGEGDAYTSITLAGSLIFAGNESGRMAVIRPGRDFQVLAINQLDKFRSTPVFEGNRMYLRTYKFLYCIGATTE